MSKRGSEWDSLRRGLLIVQLLLQGDAPKDDIIAYVRKIEGAETYPNGATAQERAFARDKDNLKRRLNVEISYNHKTQQYTLQNPGPLLALGLSARGKRALALLSQTFTGQAGEHSDIETLLQELIRHLPQEERRFLEDPSQPIGMDILQNIDPNGIPARVWQIVQRAVREKRKLIFNHFSPRYEDHQPRRFEVAAHRIVYQWGHWYLRGYSLLRPAHVQAALPEPPYLRWRIAYIKDDDTLAVSPAKLPPMTHRPPRILVHYRLLPRLARGSISKHFDEMHITNLPDGSAEIRGYTDDAWEAARLLLGYGQYCITLGGEEVQKQVHEAIRGMYANLDEAF